MPKSLTNEEFIQKATIKHNGIYNYDKCNYQKSNRKVIIICKIHGEFSQKPNNHLNGLGCYKCGLINRPIRITASTFIEKAKLVHGDRYDYSSLNFKNTRLKVAIGCRIHGIFYQNIYSHLNGINCSKCSDIITAYKNRTTVEEFIRKSNLKHKNKYDYSNVQYKKLHNKVEIICPIHGKFLQKADDHLKGVGCRTCSIDTTGWKFTNWKKAGDKSRYFESFKVYIVECYNENERFYKIGKTYKKLTDRFAGKQFPYNYKVMKIYEGDADYISKLEVKLKNENASNRYIPGLKFGGSKECFIAVMDGNNFYN